MKRLIPFLLLIGCAIPPRNTQAPPQNIILLIGDGMGLSQITLTRLLHGPLALDEFPVTGLATTHSADAWVTDSAASATAIASGFKTKNFAVGVDPKGNPLSSILMEAKKRHWKTGLVTTSRITHATPAAFAAHVDQRAKEDEIARQYLEAQIDVLFGGGTRFFSPELKNAYHQRKYALLTSSTALDPIHPVSDKLLCLFAEDHLPYVLDRPEHPRWLAAMTKRALDILSPDGFFLLVEGARIDMACHASDAAAAVAEMREFDEAIRVVLDFARKDGHTLVLVTADHGTGALAITEKTEVHRDHFAKVTASAEAMMREVKEGRSLRDVLKDRAGVEDVTDEEEGLFASAQGAYDPASVIGEIVSKHLGVTFIPFDYRIQKPNTTHGHDGAMVPVYAFGPGAVRFTGTLDNTDLPKRIRELTQE